MFRLIKQVLIGFLSFSKFLASIVNASNHAKSIFFNNQQCMTKPTLINLHPNKYG